MSEKAAPGKAAPENDTLGTIAGSSAANTQGRSVKGEFRVLEKYHPTICGRLLALREDCALQLMERARIEEELNSPTQRTSARSLLA